MPWESASRIVRRARHARPRRLRLAGRGLLGSHFALGTGGTCYESNYAFFGLLRRLGYDGYLTINDMGGDRLPQRDRQSCSAARSIWLMSAIRSMSCCRYAQ